MPSSVLRFCLVESILSLSPMLIPWPSHSARLILSPSSSVDKVNTALPALKESLLPWLTSRFPSLSNPLSTSEIPPRVKSSKAFLANLFIWAGVNSPFSGSIPSILDSVANSTLFLKSLSFQ